jgi:hypothetical protein
VLHEAGMQHADTSSLVQGDGRGLQPAGRQPQERRSTGQTRLSCTGRELLRACCAPPPSWLMLPCTYIGQLQHIPP